VACDGKPRHLANRTARLNFLQQVCRSALNHGLTRRIAEGTVVVFCIHELVIRLLLANSKSLLKGVPITQTFLCSGVQFTLRPKDQVVLRKTGFACKFF
jgi:hypothetical protein